MTAGLQIISNAGTTLISADDPTLALKAKGNAEFPNEGQIPTNFVSIGIGSATRPVMAYRVNDAAAPTGVTAFIDSFSSSTLNLRVAAVEAGSCQLTWYHFDMPVQSASTFGLKTYNSAGVCMFDSNLKHGVIAAIVNITQSPQTINLTSGRDYAILAPHPGYVRFGALGNSVTIRNGIGGTAIILDVTGY